MKISRKESSTPSQTPSKPINCYNFDKFTFETEHLSLRTQQEDDETPEEHWKKLIELEKNSDFEEIYSYQIYHRHYRQEAPGIFEKRKNPEP